MPASLSNLPPELRITLFGAVSIRRDGEPPVDLPPQLTAALLAYLALHVGQTHRREALISHFRPDKEPEKGGQNLRHYLHVVRKLLEQPPFAPGSVLQTTNVTVRL